VPKKASKKPGATILPFPGGKPPPKLDLLDPFPVRSRVERAKIRVQLAELRGVLSMQHLQLLGRVKQIISDYGHMLQVYLAPHEFAELEGLDESTAMETLMGIQRAALGLLLPTERDTLANALKTFVAAMRDSIQLERMVAGLPVKGRPVGDHPGERQADGEGGPEGVKLEECPLPSSCCSQIA
jgi:hypothetical protein